MSRRDEVLQQFEEIKALTSRGGLTLRELLPLASQNDPYSVGQPARQKTAAWFAQLWQTIGWSDGTHLRRFHYKVASQVTPPAMLNGLPYSLTDACWNELQMA